MKVLHVLNSNIYSGAENVVCTIMKNMREGDECLYLSRDGDIRRKLSQLDLPFTGVEKLGRKELKEAVASFSPDIIHAHDFKASILASGLPYGRITGPGKREIPVISHLHSNRPWMKKPDLRTILYGASFGRYAHVLAVSDSVPQEYYFGRTQGVRMETVGNPFSVESIKNLAADAPDDGGLSTSECDILFVGRLTEAKNLPLFIETVGLVRKRLPDIKASIVGSGELEDMCRTLIEERGLSDNIAMEGYSDNPYRRMAWAKLLLLPSSFEGFGLVALEAMSLGVPVFACPVGGLASIVTPECGGLYHTAEEFAAEILRLLSYPALYAEKSEGAKKRAEQYDNVDEYMDKLYSIYEDVLI